MFCWSCEEKGARSPTTTFVIDVANKGEVPEADLFGGHVLTFIQFIEKITYVVVKPCTDGVPRKGVIAAK